MHGHPLEMFRALQIHPTQITCDTFSPHYDPRGGEDRNLSIIDGEKFNFVFTPMIEETMISSWVNTAHIWLLKNVGIVLLYEITSKESFLHLESICGRLLALRISPGDTSAQADKVNQSATDEVVDGSLAAITVGTKSDLEPER